MKKRPSFFWAILPIITMIILTSIGFIANNLPIQPLLIISSIIGTAIAIGHGYTWNEIMDSIVKKISKALPASLILLSVGMLIGTWMAGGTIPFMMYYGLKIINPSFLLITAFYVTAITSLCTGTSWGSVGTIGVALMGVGAGLDMNLAAVAGAVISGAYFGDKLSPLSDSTNLAPIAAGSELYEHIRHQLWTTLASFVVASIVYLIAGMGSQDISVATPEKVTIILDSLKSLFSLNIVVLIPLVVVLYGSIAKKPTIPVMVISSVIAAFNAIVFQGVTIKNTFDSILKGFNISMIEGVDMNFLIADVPKLLNRGGMTSMLGTLLMTYCAFSFAGVVDVSGSFNVILDVISKKVRSTGQLILTTLLCGITTGAITCNAALSTLLIGELFSEKYKESGLQTKNLSRTLEDSITVTGALIPWTLGAVYMASTLGVPTLSYLPWAVLNYSCIIFATIWGFTGIGIAKIYPIKTTEAGL